MRGVKCGAFVNTVMDIRFPQCVGKILSNRRTFGFLRRTVSPMELASYLFEVQKNYQNLCSRVHLERIIVSQEVKDFAHLRILDVHYRAHNSLPVVRIFSRMNEVNTSLYCVKYLLIILLYHLRVTSFSEFSPFLFSPTKILYTVLSFTVRATCTVHVVHSIEQP